MMTKKQVPFILLSWKVLTISVCQMFVKLGLQTHTSIASLQVFVDLILQRLDSESSMKDELKLILFAKLSSQTYVDMQYIGCFANLT